jgi:hypothetical protein
MKIRLLWIGISIVLIALFVTACDRPDPEYYATPSAERLATATAEVMATAEAAAPRPKDTLFVVLSEDQTKLLAAREGQQVLDVLYRLPASFRAFIRSYPASFPNISSDGVWVSVVENPQRASASIWQVPLTGGEESQEILGWRGPQFEASISPDGKHVAFLSADGQCPDRQDYKARLWCSDLHVYVMNSDGSNIKRITEQSGDYCLLRWSPLNTQISYREMCDPTSIGTTPSNVFVVTLTPYNTAKKVTSITANGSGGTWSPNGDWFQWQDFQVTPDEGPIHLTQLDATGNVKNEVKSPLTGSVVWSPDSLRLASITQGSITFWNVETKALTTTKLSGVLPTEPMRWLPDGRLVFAGQPVDSEGNVLSGRHWYVVNGDGTGLRDFVEKPQ